MNQKEQALAVVGALESLQAIALNTSNRRKKMELGVGICTPITEKLKFDALAKYVWLSHRAACFKSWPEFSGNEFMPVPPLPKGVYSDPSRCYWATRNKWAGTYGKARMRLLAHCIAYFKTLSEAK